jgi:hypothetical protein
MATKKAKKENLGFVVIAPDGKLYFVSQDDSSAAPVIIHMLTECMDAFTTIGKCLKEHGLFKSDKVVLSGVMTKANSKLLSPKGMGQRSAKRRP